MNERELKERLERIEAKAGSADSYGCLITILLIALLIRSC